MTLDAWRQLELDDGSHDRALGSQVAEALRHAGEEAERWRQERNRLVREAIESGGTLRAVADAAGLTHSGVHTIVWHGLSSEERKAERRRQADEAERSLDGKRRAVIVGVLRDGVERSFGRVQAELREQGARWAERPMRRCAEDLVVDGVLEVRAGPRNARLFRLANS